jgi:hypothetical protein
MLSWVAVDMDTQPFRMWDDGFEEEKQPEGMGSRGDICRQMDWPWGNETREGLAYVVLQALRALWGQEPFPNPSKVCLG